MSEIDGDILDVTKGVICHQVNTRGIAGAGLALQIRKKYPEWYKWYQALFRADTRPRLGQVRLGWAIERRAVILANRKKEKQ